MTPQTDFETFPFSDLIVASLNPETSLEGFVQNILSWQQAEEFIIGFDRSLWTKLTNGLIPPQLYPHKDAKDLENFFFIGASNIKIKELSDISNIIHHEKKFSPELGGELIKANFMEDEFKGGRYLLYVAGSKIMSDVIGCRKASFSNKQNCELFLTEEVYELDEALSSIESKSFYFYIPSLEKLQELPELLEDFEKIHLSENITGIRC